MFGSYASFGRSNVPPTNVDICRKISGLYVTVHFPESLAAKIGPIIRRPGATIAQIREECLAVDTRNVHVTVASLGRAENEDDKGPVTTFAGGELLAAESGSDPAKSATV